MERSPACSMSTSKLSVSAIQIPHVNVNSVVFDDARDAITGLSSDRITFTH